jgi:hypothetical protein
MEPPLKGLGSYPRHTSKDPGLMQNSRKSVHGLPAVVAPVFFPSSSKGDECWWETQDLNTVYLWDTMDNEDRQDSLEVLHEKDNWVIWKTKDTKWTQELQRTDFHQLLSLNKNTRADCWGNKIKGWWWRGDIKTTKCQKTRQTYQVR